MRVYDLILKKRNGGSLTADEINYLIKGYVAGDIPDYQISALAMAIYFRGLDETETLNLTRAMIDSGDTISLSAIRGIKVDKHSTGGVGDTTTLVLAPLVASAGAPVAKLSGRGLGHTGGTLDKLESIPGLSTEMSVTELIQAVKSIGVAVAGQTGNLVPADKLLYALRDVTATVDSLPLIAASIMSKKLAAGADALVLDVKSGDGAFLKSREEAVQLGHTMVSIGKGAGKKTVALITSMEQPLGCAIGNALEVREAIQTLRGEGPEDLAELCFTLGGWMLTLAGLCDGPGQGRSILIKKITEGAALAKFAEMVVSQHGNGKVAEDLAILPVADKIIRVKASRTGYVERLKAEAIGVAAMTLGAGREKKDSKIDPAAGIVLEKKLGDPVKSGETLAVLHLSKKLPAEHVDIARELVLSAYSLGSNPVQVEPLVNGVIE